LAKQPGAATATLDLINLTEEPAMPKTLSFLTLMIFALASAPAHAHWGHVGELAGHGHVIAIGAAAAAAALAAAIALTKPEKEDAEEEAEAELEGEGEAA
jgi:hypothetical protein